MLWAGIEQVPCRDVLFFLCVIRRLGTFFHLVSQASSRAVLCLKTRCSVFLRERAEVVLTAFREEEYNFSRRVDDAPTVRHRD